MNLMSDEAYWLVNMGLHETALFILWPRLPWRLFILKHFFKV